jgi:hypothetical protein
MFVLFFFNGIWVFVCYGEDITLWSPDSVNMGLQPTYTRAPSPLINMAGKLTASNSGPSVITAPSWHAMGTPCSDKPCLALPYVFCGACPPAHSWVPDMALDHSYSAHLQSEPNSVGHISYTSFDGSIWTTQLLSANWTKIRFNIQGFSKRLLQWYSKCYCVAGVTTTFALKGVQTIHRSTPSISINPSETSSKSAHIGWNFNCTYRKRNPLYVLPSTRRELRH